MKTILYLSTANSAFSDKELNELLVVARDQNRLLNISGVLLYINDLFVQVLEGEDDVVDDIFKKISMDPRHKNVLKVYDEPIKESLFDLWSMAFVKTDLNELSELGYFTLNDFQEITEGVANYETIKILRSILETNLKK